MKKIFYILIFIMSLYCFVNNCYASTYSVNDYYGSSTYNNYHYEMKANYACTLMANSVLHSMKFSQNNNYYFLDYDVDFVTNQSYNTGTKIGTLKDNSRGVITDIFQSANPGNIYISSSTLNGVSLYKMKHRSYTSTTDTFKGEGTVSSHNASTSYEYDYYSTSTSDTMRKNTLNSYLPTPFAGLQSIYYEVDVCYYYQPYNDIRYYYYLCQNGGASVTQTATSLSQNLWSYNYKGRLTIPKNNAENFKYLSVNAPCAITTNYSNYKSDITNAKESITYLGIYGERIDISKYLKCGSYYDDNGFHEGDGIHDFIYINLNEKENHLKRCQKCGLEIIEEHDFREEYDGIVNDICECGYVNKVKYSFIINDDYIDKIEKTYDSNSEFDGYRFAHKTGYKFNWYEKYLKYDLYSTSSEAIYVATISDIETITASRSCIYKAKYNPIHYKFSFSNLNNLNLDLTNEIDDEEFIYDEEQNINRNIDVDGYYFNGWTLQSKGKDVDFLPNEKILNYTSNDNENIVLYPVYNELEFKIKYNTTEGHYDKYKKTIEKKYKYFDNGNLIKPYDYAGGNNTFFVTYVDKAGNKYNSIADVKKYVNSEKLQNETLNLYARFSHPEIGTYERTTENTGPNKKNINYDIPTDVIDDNNEVTDTSDRYVAYPYHSVRKIKNNIEQKEVFSFMHYNFATNSNIVFRHFDSNIMSDIYNDITSYMYKYRLAIIIIIYIFIFLYIICKNKK